MKKVFIYNILIFIFLNAFLLGAEKRVYITDRVSSNQLIIDGEIEDEAWNRVEWAGDFIQRTPYENETPTQETKFKILYDDKNIYFGFRAYDSDPSKITSITAPRDWFPGDWVEVNIDSYFDKRTAFSLL